MKKLDEFVYITEMGRPKGSKNKPKTPVVNAEDVNVDDIEKSTLDGKVVPSSKADNIKPGKSADENGSKGIAAIDPPTPEDEAEWEGLDPNTMSKNARMLANAIRTEENFFILGKAGWAKTQLVTKMAKMAGYHVVTVYMEHCVRTDLGGIPAPTQDKHGRNKQEVLPPVWVTAMLDYMDEHPNKHIKWLLFLDELNQADPDTLNALMPIVLEHTVCGIHFDDMIVGACGNFSSENDSVTDIKAQKPLWARFPSHIEWETHTPDAWKSHFDWAHKKYDSEIGPDVINECEKLSEYLKSPRDITLGIYEWCKKNKGKKLFLTTQDVYDRLLDFCVDDELKPEVKNSRTFKDTMSKFAEYLIDYCRNGGQTEKKTRARGKSAQQVDKDAKEAIKFCLERGYVYNKDDNNSYVCTVDNVITKYFDPETTGINAEILRKIIKEMEAEGKSPKYQTEKDAQSAIDNGDLMVYTENNFMVTTDILKGNLRRNRKEPSKPSTSRRRHISDYE